MPDFQLRPATAADFPAIRALIRAVQINPMDLDWRHFVAAVSVEGELMGCGQIKSHKDGSFELASIAVVPEFRSQGVARAVIEHLITAHPGRLYLTCRSRLEPLYTKFGFRAIPEAQMPPYFRRVSRIFRSLRGLRLVGETLLVMQRD